MSQPVPLSPDEVSTPAGLPLKREDIKTLADKMRFDLGRFRAWHCHHDADFKTVFDAVQRCQAARLTRTHTELLDDPRYHAITQFFLTELYGGLDLSELAHEVERALPIATRLLPESVMRTSAIALDLNALTGELDQSVARYLMEQDLTVCDGNLVIAYRACHSREQRLQQMSMLRELGEGLDRYVRSRVIYATFRMAHRPAQMAGLSGLYGFLERGFEVMRPMGSAREFLNHFIGSEEAIIHRVFDDHPDPLGPLPPIPLPA